MSRARSRLPSLDPGATYQIGGPFPKPVRGRFVGWRKRHCQLHGDDLGWEAEFRKAKANGRESYLFVVPPNCSFEKEPDA